MVISLRGDNRDSFNAWIAKKRKVIVLEVEIIIPYYDKNHWSFCLK